MLLISLNRPKIRSHFLPKQRRKGSSSILAVDGILGDWILPTKTEPKDFLIIWLSTKFWTTTVTIGDYGEKLTEDLKNDWRLKKEERTQSAVDILTNEEQSSQEQKDRDLMKKVR